MSNLIIAIVGNKGGIGKTTFGYNFTRRIIEDDPTALLIDCDNDQYSSAEFAKDRAEAKILPALRVVNMSTQSLQKEISTLSKLHTTLIIEFGKSGDVNDKHRNTALELAIAIADIVVMPIQPSPVDAKTILKVEAKLPKAASGIPMFLIPNRVKSKGQLDALLSVAPQLQYFKFSKSYLEDRLCYQDSFGLDGRSIFELKTPGAKKAQQEFEQLYQEIIYDKKTI
jgi:chromosome partitioning protein